MVGTAQGAARGRRGELAAFLRERRGRISPESVGLPPGPRRRTPGLRREELAQLAGVGITWYTWLEQGRPINASEQVLGAIARSLRLDFAEESYLFRLAGATPPQRALTPDLEPQIQSVLDAIPRLPAAVLSSRYDVLRHNAAFGVVFPACSGSERRNLLWSAFTASPCCCGWADREYELEVMVGYLRGGYGRNVGDPEWERFITELSQASPEFTALWARQDVIHPASRQKRFRHPALGPFTMQVTYLTLPTTREAWVGIYSAVDDAGQRLLDLLLDHPEQVPEHRH